MIELVHDQAAFAFAFAFAFCWLASDLRRATMDLDSFMRRSLLITSSRSPLLKTTSSGRFSNETVCLPQ